MPFPGVCYLFRSSLILGMRERRESIEERVNMYFGVSLWKASRSTAVCSFWLFSSLLSLWIIDTRDKFLSHFSNAENPFGQQYFWGFYCDFSAWCRNWREKKGKKVEESTVIFFIRMYNLTVYTHTLLEKKRRLDIH